MKFNKILLLGGAYHQIPMIKEAQSQGYYVVTCDHTPENPGHKISDKYYNISTTDYNAVLALAKKINPKLVITYASDPAAPVAAYVSEKLGLPGNSYKSVLALTDKTLFRKLLQDNGFIIPKNAVFAADDDPQESLAALSFPFVIKPTDSSGSKGVSLIERPDQIEPGIKHALKYSRNNLIIAEEFIDNEQADIHGDGFVIDGNLVFTFFGDHLYTSTFNPLNPTGTIWPSSLKKDILRRLNQEIDKVIKLSGFQMGPINIEARINSSGNLYIMEIGPRNGGHFVPQAIQHATGFNMLKATLDALKGLNAEIKEYNPKHVAYYAINSDSNGTLKHLSLNEKLNPYIIANHPYVKPGDKVTPFSGSNDAIGVLLLAFASREEMEFMMSNIKQFIKPVIEQ